MNARAPRLIAGAAILLILLVLSFALLPPYVKYWRLQNYVTDLAANSAAAKGGEAALTTQILTEAAALGVPLDAGNVHVAVSQGAVKIDLLYKVQVNVGGYAIDLHFRPAAGT